MSNIKTHCVNKPLEDIFAARKTKNKLGYKPKSRTLTTSQTKPFYLNHKVALQKPMLMFIVLQYLYTIQAYRFSFNISN